MGTTIDSLIANYNPSGFATANQQGQANVAQTQASTGLTQANTGLTQQATQDQAIKNQIQQQALRDNGIMQRAMATAQITPGMTSAQQIDAMSQAAMKGGISANGYFGFKQKLNEQALASLKIPLEELANHKQIIDAAAPMVKAIHDAPVDQQDSVYANIQPQLDKLEPGIFPPQLPQDPTQRATYIGQITNAHGLSKALADEADLKAKANASNSEADLNKIKAQREQMILDSIKQGNNAAEAGQNPVDIVFPASLDPQINASYKAAYQAANRQPPDENGRRPAADTLLSAAAAHAASIRLPSNPQVIAGEAARAKAVQAATMPGEIQKGVALAQAEAPIKEGEVAANAAATEKVRQSAAALDKVVASQNSVNATVQQGETLKRLLASGGAGNATDLQTFKTLFPLFGVSLEGSHRLPGSEVDKTPGSAYDKLDSIYNGIASGRNVPARELKEAPQTIDTLVTAAIRAHNSMVDTSAKNYGIKADHIPEPAIVQHSASTGANRYSVDGGKTWLPGLPPNQQ
jgi:hypothetical protein